MVINKNYISHIAINPTCMSDLARLTTFTWRRDTTSVGQAVARRRPRITHPCNIAPGYGSEDE